MRLIVKASLNHLTKIICITLLPYALCAEEESDDSPQESYVRPKYSDIVSILIHAKVVTEVGEVPFIVMKKGQDKMRTTVKNPNARNSIIVTYLDDKVSNIFELNLKLSEVAVSQKEAAAQLFDMLMLNPAFHISQSDGFNFETEVFEGYRMEIEVEEISEDPLIERINGAKLFAECHNGERERLIRSVEIKQFGMFDEEIEEPVELVFTDEESNEHSTVSILSLAYNSGIADFVFDPLPKQKPTPEKSGSLD